MRSLVEHLLHRSLRLALNLPQMFFAAKTFRVNLVNILRARRPRGEPAVLRNHLDAADEFVVARCAIEFRFHFLAAKFFDVERIGLQFLEYLLALWRRGRVDALVKGLAEIA